MYAKPANFVRGILKEVGVHDDVIAMYGWRLIESHDDVEGVTGFLKSASRAADRTLNSSGKTGVFIEKLAKQRGLAPVKWIEQATDETDDKYYERVTRMTTPLGLAYRRQGRSRLGVRANSTDPADPATNKNRLWEARGIARSWTTGALTAWLEREFSAVQLQTSPNNGKGWIFKGKPNTSALCFAYEMDGHTIGISQLFRQNKPPKHTAILTLGVALASRVGASLWRSKVGHPNPSVIEVAATQLDEGGAQDETTESHEQAEKRSADTKVSSAKKKCRSDMSNAIDRPFGYDHLDLGGNGECAYRAVAAAYALTSNW